MNEYLISSLSQQWKKDPTSRVFFRLAEEYRKGGVYDKAIEVCSEGIAHHPNYLPALVSLGRSHLGAGDEARAEETFLRVLAVAPDNPHALRGLGTMYHKQGRDEEARRYLETLLLEEPTDEEAQSRLHQILEATVATDTASDDPDDDLDDDMETEPITMDFSEFEDVPPETPAEVAPSVSEEAIDQAFDAVSDLPEELSSDDFRDDEDEATEAQDPIEAEFALAMSEVREEHRATRSANAAETGLAPVSLSARDELRLTQGLKHEKMAHYEAAQHIYRSLQHKYPGDRIVSGHLERIDLLIAREGKTPKKIRLLNNWLDKIKGDYHVR